MRLKAPGKPAIAPRGLSFTWLPQGTLVTTETGPKRPMRTSSLPRSIQNVCVAALLLVAAFLGTAGLPSAAEAAVVSRIIVEGNQRVDEATVAAYVLVQPGQSFSAREIDESLKALFETGLFADVAINQVGNSLVVTVVE